MSLRLAVLARSWVTPARFQPLAIQPYHSAGNLNEDEQSGALDGPPSSAYLNPYSFTTSKNISAMAWWPAAFGWMQVPSNQTSASAPR